MSSQKTTKTADVLNDHFASVLEVEDDQDLPTFPEQPFTQMIEHIEITNVSVSKAMKTSTQVNHRART